MLVLRCAYGKLLQGVGQLWGACRCRGSIRMEPVIPVSGIVKDVCHQTWQEPTRAPLS